MRIGIWSESYEPILNGVSVSISTLTRELRDLGHEVYVFAPAYPGHRDPDENVFRFPSFSTPFERGYPLPVPYMPGLYRMVRDLKLDIIHTHTPWMLGVLGLKMARRLGIPIVSTNHTRYAEYAHYFPLAPKKVTQSFIIWRMRSYYNQCDGVIVPSKPVAEILAEYGVDTPTYTIATGNALDTSRRPEARLRIRKQYGIGPEDRVLLYLSRLAKEKNIELLLDSFERLAPEYPDLHLMIAGGGPYEAECRRMASQLKASSRIIFTSFVPRDKVVEYYSAGDIFTFPSVTETQGIVLCEALAAGLPCVAVRAGGSPEMLIEGLDGLLTENSADDFAAKTGLLLSDPELLERYSSNAVENSCRFSPGGMALRVLETYEAVRAAHGA